MSTDEAVISVNVRDEGATTVVAVGGELEYGTAASLRATLSDLARAGREAVVLDLRDLGFIDSVGLSLLVQAKLRFVAEGTRLELRDLAPNVARVFETSGLTELFAL